MTSVTFGVDCNSRTSESSSTRDMRCVCFFQSSASLQEPPPGVALRALDLVPSLLASFFLVAVAIGVMEMNGEAEVEGRAPCSQWVTETRLLHAPPVVQS